MNDQLKQRLVGAIVLVSLAVIFIPMILPGGGVGDSISDRKVPPEPDYRFPPPKDIPEAPPISDAVIVPIGESETKSTSSDQQKDKEVANKTSSLKETAKKLAISTPTKDKIVKPDQVTAWIVQVGSFTSAPNAKSLRDKLRKLGYASFVEAVKTKKGMNYRVRVGPELTRTLADKLRKKLEKDAQLKGMVQSYP